MRFLEKQLKNTNTLKAKYRKEIQLHLEALKEAKDAHPGEEEISPTRVKEIFDQKRKKLGQIFLDS